MEEKKKKKPKRIEKCIFIDEFQLNVHILKITRKLHGFGPRYNPKQKYIVLFSNYILKIENYMEKRTLLVIDLSSKFRFHDWEDIRHPTSLAKLDFYTLVAMIISYYSRVYVIQEHVIEKKNT